MKSLKQAVVCVAIVVLGLFLGTQIPSACATSGDFKEFTEVQRKGNEAIAQGFRDLRDGVITTEQAEQLVTATVAKREAETDKKIEKIEDRVLAWWQVICAGAASAIPVVYAGMKILDRHRNSTREATVEEIVERKLQSKGIA